jgi:hypothetical protein
MAVRPAMQPEHGADEQAEAREFLVAAFQDAKRVPVLEVQAVCVGVPEARGQEDEDAV